MKFFLNQNTSPAFNLALEEFLFKQEDDYFLLWRNEPCVVSGKHQNLLAEINHSFVLENKIPVYRRISGGGTVYHDLGNINFSVIISRPEDKLVDFKRYMTPVFNALTSMGLPVEFSERNDIYLNGKKISGNAEHAVRNRVLHHGTLLFDANLDHLRGSIANNRSKYKGRSVASVPASVGNIKPFLQTSMDTETFIQQLENYLLTHLPAEQIIELQQDEVTKVNELRLSKYEKDNWNIGYGPKYVYTGSATLDGEQVELELSVSNGMIDTADCLGNWPNGLKEKLIPILQHQYHFPENINELVQHHDFTSEEVALIMSLCFEL